MEIKYAYITTATLGNGEIAVQGKRADGSLLFGFRSMADGLQSWKAKARAYTPPSYIPAFSVPVRLQK